MAPTTAEEEALRAAGMESATPLPGPADSILDKLVTAEKVEVWQLKSGKRDQYCGRFPKDRFNTDPGFIGNEYGPGDYRVWGIDSEGHYVKGEVGEISMAGAAFKDPEPPKPKNNGMQPMTEGAAMMAAILGGVAAIADKFAPMLLNRTDDTQRLVNLVTALKTINGDHAPVEGRDRLDDFLRGLELGKGVLGTGSTAVAITSAVEKVATRYLDMVDPKIVQRVRELPHGNGTGSGNGHAEENPLKLSFGERMLLEKVCEMFSQKVDAEDSAAEIMNMIGPGFMPKLDDFVSKSDAVDILISADARIKDGKAWLNSVMDFLRPMAKDVATKVRAAQSPAPQSAAG